MFYVVLGGTSACFSAEGRSCSASASVSAVGDSSGSVMYLYAPCDMREQGILLVVAYAESGLREAYRSGRAHHGTNVCFLECWK
jgi:hypothetical protein